ncbi:leucine-rich repeat domain-containing protein [Rickettsiales endosymbiont of Stachyamoeba lipophora]|uniref:hypothetical protein n=1 Tax=Rickettsiales endosymbiont of Stachyamoeba lipophora TaxID=2486578 RepID=UPI0013DE0B3F|nr:hypothetical protein [Rickettsiales endosymbiont of Stachyamoeba lipophora]
MSHITEVPKEIFAHHIFSYFDQKELINNIALKNSLFQQGTGYKYTETIRPIKISNLEVFDLAAIKTDIIQSINALDIGQAEKRQKKDLIKKIWDQLIKGEVAQDADLANIKAIFDGNIIFQEEVTKKLQSLLVKLYPNFKINIEVTYKNISSIINAINQDVNFADSLARIVQMLDRNDFNNNFNQYEWKRNVLQLISILPQCSNLQSLNLIYNGMEAEDAKALAEVLPSTNIHSLDLSRNNIGADGTTALAGALPHTNIHSLKLSRNNIGAGGATALAAVLPDTNIHSLDLSNNNIGEDGTITLAEGVIALAKVLPRTNVHTINLGDNDLRVGGARALADVLPQCGNLHNLYLSGNKIGDEGASALAAVLPHTKLYILSLHGNLIGDKGAIYLAAVLSRINKLHSFTLSNNNIGVAGVSALARVLSQCTNLQTIDFYGNLIGKDGASALAAVLPHANTNNICSFDLGYNLIGEEGARILGEAIGKVANCKIIVTFTGHDERTAYAERRAFEQARKEQHQILQQQEAERQRQTEAELQLQAEQQHQQILQQQEAEHQRQAETELQLQAEQQQALQQQEAERQRQTEATQVSKLLPTKLSERVKTIYNHPVAQTALKIMLGIVGLGACIAVVCYLSSNHKANIFKSIENKLSFLTPSIPILSQGIEQNKGFVSKLTTQARIFIGYNS